MNKFENFDGVIEVVHVNDSSESPTTQDSDDCVDANHKDHSESCCASYFFLAAIGYVGAGIAVCAPIMYISLMLRDGGHSPGAIGLIVSGNAVGQSTLVPLVLFLADRYDALPSLATISITISSAFLFVACGLTDKSAVAASVVLYFLFFGCCMATYDRSILAALGPQHKEEWGRYRGIMSAAFGVGSLLLPLMLSVIGWISLAVQFTCGYYIALAVILYYRPLSRGQKKSKAVENQNSINMNILDVLRFIFSDTKMTIFLLGITALGIPVWATICFLPLYIKDLGGSEMIVGWSSLSMITIEVMLFLLGERILRVLSLELLFLSGMLGMLARLIIFFVMHAAWIAIPANVLHGLSFGASWFACIQLFAQKCPSAMANSAYGVITVGWRGISTLVGNVVGGVLYSSLGPRNLWGILALWTAVSTALFIFYMVFSEATYVGKAKESNSQTARDPPSLQAQNSKQHANRNTPY